MLNKNVFTFEITMFKVITFTFWILFQPYSGRRAGSVPQTFLDSLIAKFRASLFRWYLELPCEHSSRFGRTWPSFSSDPASCLVPGAIAGAGSREPLLWPSSRRPSWAWLNRTGITWRENWVTNLWWSGDFTNMKNKIIHHRVHALVFVELFRTVTEFQELDCRKARFS